jgi:hypothetical protein
MVYRGRYLGVFTNDVDAGGFYLSADGFPPLQYEIIDGGLPAGFGYAQNLAAFSAFGTPSDEPGEYSVTVRATDHSTGLSTVAVFTLTLVAAPEVTWNGVEATVRIDLLDNYAVTNLPADYAVASDPLSKTRHLYLRRIAANGYTKGSPAGEWNRTDAREDQVDVTLSSYYIGVYAVTAYQYAFVNAGTTGGAATPQANVSWNVIRRSAAVGATAAGWLAKLTLGVANNPANAGKLIAFDLPTDAQWENAGRGRPAHTRLPVNV